MLYLLQSKSEEYNAEDIIVNTDYIKYITIQHAVEANIFSIGIRFNQDNDRDDDMRIANFGSEDDARRELYNILRASGLDITESDAMSKNYRLIKHDHKKCDGKREIIESLMELKEKLNKVASH